MKRFLPLVHPVRNLFYQFFRIAYQYFSIIFHFEHCFSGAAFLHASNRYFFHHPVHPSDLSRAGLRPADSSPHPSSLGWVLCVFGMSGVFSGSPRGISPGVFSMSGLEDDGISPILFFGFGMVFFVVSCCILSLLLCSRRLLAA